MLLYSSDDFWEQKVIAEVINFDLLNNKYNKFKITTDERFPKNSDCSIWGSNKSSVSTIYFKTKLKLPCIELKKMIITKMNGFHSEANLKEYARIKVLKKESSSIL